MDVLKTEIEEVLVIEPDVYTDDRGFFMETFQQDRYAHMGIRDIFVQDNLSESVKNTLRGLHFQVRHPQSKLIQVIAGEIFDVAVDIRPGSGTFGKWVGIYLSSGNKKQLYVPEGFAHGFCVMSDTAVVSYKSSDIYHPEDEGGLAWNDPDVNIDWPVTDSILSEKDGRLPFLSEINGGNA
jgi:dTDP-4-dehydrorhamnose 3,5-epimerase